MRICVVALALLAACAGPPAADPPKGWTPGAPPELLALVPPDLRYLRVDLPPEQNAFTPWQRAVAAFVHAKDPPELKAAWDRAADGDGPFPGGDEGRLLCGWLDRNREALALWVEGSRHPRCQFPPMMEGFNSQLPYLAPIKNIALAASVRAKRSAAAGDFESAANDLLATLRCGDLTMEGEGGLIHVLVGMAVQNIALEGFRWLAAQPGVPRKVLEGVLARVAPGSRAGEGLAHAWRIELCCCYLPAIADPVKLRYEFNGLGSAATDRTLNESALEDLVTQAMARADRKSTVALFCRFYTRLVADATSPWKTRDRFIERDVRAVQEELTNAVESNLAVAATVTASAYLFRRYVLGEVDLERASRAAWYKEVILAVFRSLPLPGGKIMFSLLMPANESATKSDRMGRARREAVRALVAIRLFADRRGRLPDALDELVAEGILPAVPLDPFTDRPLRYSKERKVVWSVGPDEVDDGGAIDPDLSPTSKDYAWPVQVPGPAGR
jgi:hypothetical protein